MSEATAKAAQEELDDQPDLSRELPESKVSPVERATLSLEDEISEEQARIVTGADRVSAKAEAKGGKLTDAEAAESKTIIEESKTIAAKTVEEIKALAQRSAEISAKAESKEGLSADEKKEQDNFVVERFAAADQAEKERASGNLEHLKALYPKTWELRAKALKMKDARTELADAEADAKKHQGVGGAVKAVFSTENDPKGASLARLEEAKKTYDETRAEYVGDKIERSVKERGRLADAAVEQLAQEKGLGSKVYDAYKKLGELNLTKLGWEPKSRLGQAIARGASVRTLISLGLAGAGLAFGAGAAAGAAAIFGRRVLSGMGASVGSYDLMKAYAGRAPGSEQLSKMSTEDVVKALESQEAKAMVDGRKLDDNAAYRMLKSEYGKRKLDGAKDFAEWSDADQAEIAAAMVASDASLVEKMKSESKKELLRKGAAGVIGMAVGGGALAKGVAALRGDTLTEAIPPVTETPAPSAASAVEDPASTSLDAPSVSANETIPAELPVGETPAVGSPDAVASAVSPEQAVKMKMDLAAIGKGEGVVKVAARQIAADPEKFGYDTSKHGDLSKWSSKLAGEFARKEGLMGKGLRMKGHLVLSPDGKFSGDFDAYDIKKPEEIPQQPVTPPRLDQPDFPPLEEAKPSVPTGDVSAAAKEFAAIALSPDKRIASLQEMLSQTAEGETKMHQGVRFMRKGGDVFFAVDEGDKFRKITTDNVDILSRYSGFAQEMEIGADGKVGGAAHAVDKTIAQAPAAEASPAPSETPAVEQPAPAKPAAAFAELDKNIKAGETFTNSKLKFPDRMAAIKSMLPQKGVLEYNNGQFISKGAKVMYRPVEGMDWKEVTAKNIEAIKKWSTFAERLPGMDEETAKVEVLAIRKELGYNGGVSAAEGQK